MKKLKLQDGKKYRRRDGKIVEVTKKKNRFYAPSLSTSIWALSGYYYYLSNGRCNNHTEVPEDLIEEV